MLGADPLSKSAAIEALHAYPGRPVAIFECLSPLSTALLLVFALALALALALVLVLELALVLVVLVLLLLLSDRRSDLGA